MGYSGWNFSELCGVDLTGQQLHTDPASSPNQFDLISLFPLARAAGDQGWALRHWFDVIG